MPRHPRIHLPDLPLHIVQRGHNRDACFFADDDRHAYLHWLEDALNATGCALHAYVLMANHVHLLLTPTEPGAVTQVMISLGRRYVQYINRTYHRTGTLWEGRYKSSLVEADSYLFCCQRYIELNPVRATMVDAPRDYRWSSYRCNAEGSSDPLVTPHSLYLALGRDAEGRQAAYRELFRHHLETDVLSDIRIAVQQSQPVGSTRFFDTIERMTGQRREPKSRGHPRRKTSATAEPVSTE